MNNENVQSHWDFKGGSNIEAVIGWDLEYSSAQYMKRLQCIIV